MDASGATSVLWRLSLTLSPGPGGDRTVRECCRSGDAACGKACSCVEAGLKWTFAWISLDLDVEVMVLKDFKRF